MAERGWTTAAVVTSDYHLTRALWIAADLGMQAVGAAAASPNRWGARLRAYGRETVSWRSMRCAGCGRIEVRMT